MQKLSKSFFFAVLFACASGYSQTPSKPNAVNLYHQLKKVNFLGSVLYVAAHPDDENTRLISYLANEQLDKIKI
jgi:hypothetical protein